MKKTKTLFLVLMALILTAASFSLSASASDPEDLILELIPDKTDNVSVGDEITILVNFPNFESSIGRLEAIAGTIAFDPEVFSFVKASTYVNKKYITISSSFPEKFGFFWYDEGYMLFKGTDKEKFYTDQLKANNGRFLNVVLKVKQVIDSEIYFYEHLPYQLIGTNEVSLSSKELKLYPDGKLTALEYTPYAASGDYAYSILDGKAELKEYFGNETDITVPSEIDGYPVDSLKSDLFKEKSFILSATIPDNVTSIRDYAFYGCENLTSVTIPESVTAIEPTAFQQCDELTIYCTRNASAVQYAVANNIPVRVTNIIAGDVNEDGKLNANDLICIKKHLLGIESLSDEIVAIYKNDKYADDIDIVDMVLIKRAILQEIF